MSSVDMNRRRVDIGNSGVNDTPSVFSTRFVSNHEDFNRAFLYLRISEYPRQGPIYMDELTERKSRMTSPSVRFVVYDMGTPVVTVYSESVLSIGGQFIETHEWRRDVR